MRNPTVTKPKTPASAYVVRYWDEELGKVMIVPCDERGQAITKRAKLIEQGYEVVVSDVAAGKLIDE